MPPIWKTLYSIGIPDDLESARAVLTALPPFRVPDHGPLATLEYRVLLAARALALLPAHVEHPRRAELLRLAEQIAKHPSLGPSNAWQGFGRINPNHVVEAGLAIAGIRPLERKSELIRTWKSLLSGHTATAVEVADLASRRGWIARSELLTTLGARAASARNPPATWAALRVLDRITEDPAWLTAAHAANRRLLAATLLEAQIPHNRAPLRRSVAAIVARVPAAERLGTAASWRDQATGPPILSAALRGPDACPRPIPLNLLRELARAELPADAVPAWLLERLFGQLDAGRSKPTSRSISGTSLRLLVRWSARTADRLARMLPATRHGELFHAIADAGPRADAFTPWLLGQLRAIDTELEAAESQPPSAPGLVFPVRRADGGLVMKRVGAAGRVDIRYSQRTTILRALAAVGRRGILGWLRAAPRDEEQRAADTKALIGFALSSTDASVRTGALDTLLAFHMTDACGDELIRALRYRDCATMRGVVTAMSTLRELPADVDLDRTLRPGLLAACQIDADTTRQVVRCIDRLLPRIDDDAWATLAELTLDEDRDLRLAILDVARNRQRDAAPLLPAIRDLLTDPRPDVRTAARQAIESIDR